MSKIGTEYAALTNDDMGETTVFTRVDAEKAMAEAQAEMRLWELTKYTKEELQAELDTRVN